MERLICYKKRSVAGNELKGDLMSITGNFVSTLSSSAECIQKPDAINLLIRGLELTQNYKSYRKHATKMTNLNENDKLVTEKLSCATLLSFKRQLKLKGKDSK